MRTRVLCLTVLLMLGGCGDKPEQKQAPEPETAPEATERDDALTDWYRQKAAEQKRTLAIRARTFRDAIAGLLQSPEAARLQTARQTWKGLYESFNAALVPLYSRAQLDSDAARRLRRTDPLPVFPGYIDGLKQWPDSGIVNDVTVPLTEKELIAQLGATAEGEVSLGFQVIHFLLHGEPGEGRTAEDFKSVTEKADDVGVSLEQLPENRRRRYLKTATTVLTDDLGALTSRQADLVTTGILVESMRRLTEKLIRLANLTEATDVAGEYMAPASRELADKTLVETLKNWTGPDTPLMQALEQQGIDTGGLRDGIAAVSREATIGPLQELHAKLAAVGDQLRAGQ